MLIPLQCGMVRPKRVPPASTYWVPRLRILDSAVIRRPQHTAKATAWLEGPVNLFKAFLHRFERHVVQDTEGEDAAKNRVLKY